MIILVELTETEDYLGNFETADEMYARLVRFKNDLYNQVDTTRIDTSAS